MSHTTVDTVQDAAAVALTTALPLPAAVRAARSVGAPVGTQVTNAVTATLVGASGADLAVALIDESQVAVDPASQGAADAVAAALTPALQAAGKALGDGVVSGVRHEDATALFLDPATVVFELADQATGATCGWFALRPTTPAPTTTGSQDRDGSDRISLIADVPMTLTVEIGQTDMTVREALYLAPNQVVQLDRSAGEPADIRVNGRLIARGTVVVIDADYGVKVTEILDPSWRP